VKKIMASGKGDAFPVLHPYIDGKVEEATWDQPHPILKGQKGRYVLTHTALLHAVPTMTDEGGVEPVKGAFSEIELAKVVESKVAEPGTSQVQFTESLSSSDKVVVKKIYIKDPDHLKRIEKEARYWFKLSDIEGIPKLYEAIRAKDEDGRDCLFFVSEYVGGGCAASDLLYDWRLFYEGEETYELREFLLGEHHLTLDQVRLVTVFNLVDLLRQVHHLGVEHGDLNLNNLLFDKEGALKLIDFGWSEDIQNVEAQLNVRSAPVVFSPEKYEYHLKKDTSKKPVAGKASHDAWSVHVLGKLIQNGKLPFEDIDDWSNAHKWGHIILDYAERISKIPKIEKKGRFRGFFEKLRVAKPTPQAPKIAEESSLDALLAKLGHIDPKRRMTVEEIYDDLKKMVSFLGNAGQDRVNAFRKDFISDCKRSERATVMKNWLGEPSEETPEKAQKTEVPGFRKERYEGQVLKRGNRIPKEEGLVTVLENTERSKRYALTNEGFLLVDGRVAKPRGGKAVVKGAKTIPESARDVIAEATSFEESVAIKKVRILHDRDFELLEKEAENWRELSDISGFPKLYDAFVAPDHEGDDCVYFIMEPISGGSDLQTVMENHILTETTTLESDLLQGLHLSLGDVRAVIFLQVARILAQFHEKGLLHGDLKVENLAIGGDGRVWLIDAGSVKAKDRSEELYDFRGTDSYLNPAIIQHYVSLEDRPGSTLLEPDYHQKLAPGQTYPDVWTLGIVGEVLFRSDYPYQVDFEGDFEEVSDAQRKEIMAYANKFSERDPGVTKPHSMKDLLALLSQPDPKKALWMTDVVAFLELEVAKLDKAYQARKAEKDSSSLALRVRLFLSKMMRLTRLDRMAYKPSSVKELKEQIALFSKKLSSPLPEESAWALFGMREAQRKLDQLKVRDLEALSERKVNFPKYKSKFQSLSSFFSER